MVTKQDIKPVSKIYKNKTSTSARIESEFFEKETNTIFTGNTEIVTNSPTSSFSGNGQFKAPIKLLFGFQSMTRVSHFFFFNKFV